jgi:hypothetical protein
MFEIFKGSKEDAIAILKNDHDKVKELFEKFEKSGSLRDKKKIVAQTIAELKIHAEIEEKIFYPSVRKDIEDDIMYEADEEHHVAKLLIAELEKMDGSEVNWEAKFTVLAENIRHHIKEEEAEMLPKARKLDIDFDVMGRKLLTMKDKLKKNGLPASDEEKLMQKTKAEANSPAKAARKTIATKPAAKPAVHKNTKAGGSPVKKKVSLRTASATKKSAALKGASSRSNAKHPLSVSAKRKLASKRR